MPPVIGILSDAHGIAPAFDRAVDRLFQMGAERLYFLGDAIGYVPSPAVLTSLEMLGERVVCLRGNHEDMLLHGKYDAERENIYQLELTRQILPNSYLNWINSWTSFLSITILGMNILMIHGSPNDQTYGYVYPDTDLTQFTHSANWVFMAHTHRPFIRVHEEIGYVNVGSCAMPRDDGRFGSAVLFDIGRQNARIIRFDIQDISRKIAHQYPGVHSSVLALYDRRSDVLIGEHL